MGTSRGRLTVLDIQPVVLVNLDTAFATNFVTDLAWLWGTGSLAGSQLLPWRLGLASAVGAMAAVWAYFPGGRWLTSGPGALVGTVILLGLAFWPKGRVEALRIAAYFILIGGAMAGVAMLIGSRNALPGSPQSGEVSSGLVAAGLILTLVGARYLWESARERSRLKHGLYSMRIRLGDRTVELPALFDTGNGLRDPISGMPVVIVEAEALEEVLPPVMRQALGAGWDSLDRLPGSWAARCRLVPYRAVGRSAGLLLALDPDEISVKAPGDLSWTAVRGLLGLGAERLHPEGAYRALLPPLLLKGAQIGANTWKGETG